MKSFTLEDGRKAHFHDNASPEVIGKKLLELAAPRKQAAKPKQEQKPSEFQTRHEQIMESSEKDRQDNRAREDRQENAHKERHTKTLKAMDQQNSSMIAVAQGINKGLDAIFKALSKTSAAIEQLSLKMDGLVKSGKEIDKLSKCVDELGAQINQSSEAIVGVMKLPRKIINSPKGRPIGMQIGED